MEVTHEEDKGIADEGQTERAQETVLALPRISILALGLPALAALILHAVAGGHYGMFRDEYYYLDCARHLAWGYVDQPPLSIALLALWRNFFGDSVVTIRVLPALSNALLVILTGLMARELGGKGMAQALAAMAAFAAPTYLGITGYYSMNSFDLFFWAIAFLILLRILRTGRASLWVPLGFVLGLGLQNKISLLTFGAALAIALLLTPARRHLASKEIWIGGILASLLFLPYLAWEATHAWATLEFMHNASTRKIAALGPLGFASAQLLEMHPLNVLLALVGLVSLFRWSGGRFRMIVYLWLLAFLILALQNSKAYYLVSAYPPLLAAGACVVVGASLTRWRIALASGALALLFLGGLATAPFALPLLPVDRFIYYQNALGIHAGSGENQALGVLPQFFADRFGWEELAKRVGEAYNDLPPQVRSGTGLVAHNYGEAGAINYYGWKMGLPRAATQHNSGYFWGPPSPADAILAVGYSREDLEHAFDSVTEISRFTTSPLAMPYEREQVVYLCRDLKTSLNDAWRQGKNFI